MLSTKSTVQQGKHEDGTRGESQRPQVAEAPSIQLLQHPSAHTLLFRIKGTLQYLLSVSTARTCHVHSKQKWAWTSKV